MASAFLAAVKSGNEIDECDVVLPRSKIAELLSIQKKHSGKAGICELKVFAMQATVICIYMSV